MNQRFIHILALISCFTYLIGNIAFDLLDSPDNPAPQEYFTIPLGFMILCLVLLGWEYAKKQTLLIQDLWLCFLLLSVSQLIKFTIFNPYVSTVNDYAILFVVIIFAVKRITRKKQK